MPIAAYETQNTFNSTLISVCAEHVTSWWLKGADRRKHRIETATNCSDVKSKKVTTLRHKG